MDTGLEGKGVLVTGGAGGIGSALVRAFAAEGARVGIHYNTNSDRAEELARETGGIPLRADLRVEQQVDRLFDEAADSLGGIEALVANAGVWPSDDTAVWDMTLERWRATMAVNLDGTFMCCRAFLRQVARTQRGNIVLVGSTAGEFGEAGHADYAASKSALIYGLTLSLKNEIVRIAPTGRVNAVCPGWTVTEMTRDFVQDRSFTARTTRTMSLRKLGTAEDVARAVVMLASDEVAGHISGQIVTVAGGMEGRVLHD